MGASRSARSVLAITDSAVGSRSIWSLLESAPAVRDLRKLCRTPHQLRALTLDFSFDVFADPPADVSSRSMPSRHDGRLPLIANGASTALRLDRLAGTDHEMIRQVGLIRRIMGTGLPILLLGETGVGKDTLARAIHDESARASKPFVPFNCSAIPETLIDSELFGYSVGAFTGAKKEGSQGRVVEADGGTLFLDEIGDMPVAQQTRLLRVLESGEVTPLGGGRTRKVNLQIIAATHQDIQDRIDAGTFRQDLFYRLAGAIIQVPGLRSRYDIEALFADLIAKFGGSRRIEITSETIALVKDYAWPGNIREMKHVAQRAVSLCRDSVVRPEDLMLAKTARSPARTEKASAMGALLYNEPQTVLAPAMRGIAKSAANEAERAVIAQALLDSPGAEACAERLGISRATLYRRLKMYQIRRPRRA